MVLGIVTQQAFMQKLNFSKYICFIEVLSMHKPSFFSISYIIKKDYIF